MYNKGKYKYKYKNKMGKTYKKKHFKFKSKINNISKTRKQRMKVTKLEKKQDFLANTDLDLYPFENEYEVQIMSKEKTNKKKKEKYLSRIDKLLEQSRNRIFRTQESGKLWKKPFSKVLEVPYALKGITPNQDFYTYINYRWIQDTEIISKQTRKYYSQIDDFRVTQEKVYYDVINLVKKYIKEHHGSKKAMLVNNVYKSIMNFGKENIKVHVRHLDERYEHFVVQTKNMWGYLAEMNTNEIISWACPIPWKVQPDLKNASIYHNEISLPQLSLYDVELYSNDNNGKDAEYIAYKEKIKSHYFSYIRQVFEACLGSRAHEFSAHDVFKCEQELLDAMSCYGVKNDSPDFYNVVQKEDALKKYGFDWESFSKQLGYKNAPETFICDGLSYLQCVCKLLKEKWDSKQWKSYWYYIYLRQMIRFNKDLRHINFDFQGKIINGLQIDFPSELLPIFALSLTFNTLLSKLYIQEHQDPRIINYSQTLGNDLLTVFKRIIKRNNWLSPKTKEYALLKLEHLKIEIAKPPIMREDPLLPYGNDAWENILLITRWKTRQYIELEGKNVTDIPVIDWSQTPFKLTGKQTYVVNAYYISSENTIYVPLAYLQKPFIDLDERGIEYNLAHVGFTFGHEMSHCLDDMGSQYDYKGNLFNWWNAKDKAHFKKIQNDIIQQYQDVALRDGIHFDASIGVGEDIADISGLAICEEYLKDFQDKNGDIVPVRYTSFETFYIYFAVQQRQHLYKKALLAQLKTNPHPLDKFRTNVPLSRSTIFRNMYNVQKGDGMYWHSENTVW
jgi:putative endopeptidase